MADAIVWPCDILKPRDRPFDPVYRSASGGVAVNGFSQVVASDAGIWKVRFDGIKIRTADQVKTWRAIRSHAEGKLNPILLCICEGTRRPLPGASPIDMLTGLPHSDEAFFSDDTGYISSWTVVTTLAPAAVRAVSLSLRKINSATLEPGQVFSIKERLYEIKKIVSQTATTASIKIWPPLREAVAVNADLEFDHPVIRVRLASDDAMDLPIELNRFATCRVEFLEDV